MRDLQAKDIFKVLNVANQLEINEIIDSIDDDIFKNLDKDDKGEITEKGYQQAGIKLFGQVLPHLMENLPKAERAIYELLGSLTDTTAEEIAVLPLSDFVQLIKDFFTHQDLKELYNLVSN